MRLVACCCRWYCAGRAVLCCAVQWVSSLACVQQASVRNHPSLPLARRQLAYRRGAAAAQYKPPVTVSKPEQWQLLEQHVLASAVCP